jgi:hypothetical protein
VNKGGSCFSPDVKKHLNDLIQKDSISAGKNKLKLHQVVVL